MKIYKGRLTARVLKRSSKTKTKTKTKIKIKIKIK